MLTHKDYMLKKLLEARQTAYTLGAFQYQLENHCMNFDNVDVWELWELAKKDPQKAIDIAMANNFGNYETVR
jgi:3-oxoacyl-(acyl-carrier-protein) synthase